MSRIQRTLGWLVTLLVGLFTGVLAEALLDDAGGRLRARDGAVAQGTVVDRYRSAKAWVPSVEVVYEVDGRRYLRELDAYLDEGERVRVRYLPEEPSVSRVEGAGVAGLVYGTAGVLACGGLTAVSAHRLLTTRSRPRRTARQERPEPPAQRRPVRLRRGAVAGAAVGALLWGGLALLLGAGPPREVATALGGLSAAGASTGAAVAVLRSGVRAFGWQAWLAVVALLAGVPLALLVAAALEG